MRSVARVFLTQFLGFDIGVFLFILSVVSPYNINHATEYRFGGRAKRLKIFLQKRSKSGV
jgi:hypothetical protein